MPDVTPAGVLSLPLSRLRTLLSNVPAFQTFTGTASAAAALAKIYVDEAPPDTRPMALIALNDDWSWNSIGEGAGVDYGYNLHGSLLLMIEAAVTSTYAALSQSYNAAYEFHNSAGAVWAGICALSGSGSYLAVTGGDLVYVGRSDKREGEANDYYQAIWRLRI